MMQKKAPSKRNANSPFETVLRLGMKISSFGNSVDVGFGPKNEGEANGLLLDGCRCCVLDKCDEYTKVHQCDQHKLTRNDLDNIEQHGSECKEYDDEKYGNEDVGGKQH
ncbi:hypothetical protein BLOT_007755 [Blomia tropicalis]|nr:hypothetical protein BLOT_007755 [Blomia tropicalis]